ncbi:MULTISPECIES: PspC domain-containing protein [Paenibacillus]|uniref:PspC domain-containing protein n=1 Tax=Paenibacillus TaxID=44249 RepID=UPI00203D9184|nr:PspC domain-containing protein [Paenibacillus camelliae]
MKKLYRSMTDSKVTGLCGGIAEWFGIDATIVRLIVVISALCSFGAVALCYIVASIIVPKAPYGNNPFSNYHY